MLKRGEADFAYALDGPEAEDVKRDPRLTLVATKHASIFWIEFADQWDPKSPWADKRLRQAVNSRSTARLINEAACLGFCPPAGVIVPRVMDFALQVEPPRLRPREGQAAPGRGRLSGRVRRRRPRADPAVLHRPPRRRSTTSTRWASACRMRPTERAAFYADWQEKKLRGLFMTAVGNSGNAASRVESFIYSKGSYAYGGYPDIDDLFQQQARERDPRKREAILHRIQQLTIDRVMFAPIMDLRALFGIGPKIADSAMNIVPLTAFPSYEDMKLKGQ